MYRIARVSGRVQGNAGGCRLWEHERVVGIAHEGERDLYNSYQQDSFYFFLHLTILCCILKRGKE